jgi:hypothetical protein
MIPDERHALGVVIAHPRSGLLAWAIDKPPDGIASLQARNRLQIFQPSQRPQDINRFPRFTPHDTPHFKLVT